MAHHLGRGVVICLVAVAVTLGLTTGVLAHASLTGCNIKNHQTIRSPHLPKRLICRFAEEMDPAHSWMAVFEGVADHGLVTEQKSKVSFSNPKIMTLNLPRLQPLRYYLIWYTRSIQDGHYAAGVLYFTVKR